MHIKCIGLCRNLNQKITGITYWSISVLVWDHFQTMSCSSCADMKKLAVYWIELSFTHKNRDFHNRTKLHCANLESGFRVFHKVLSRWQKLWSRRRKNLPKRCKFLGGSGGKFLWKNFEILASSLIHSFPMDMSWTLLDLAIHRENTWKFMLSLCCIGTQTPWFSRNSRLLTRVFGFDNWTMKAAQNFKARLLGFSRTKLCRSKVWVLRWMFLMLFVKTGVISKVM